MVFRRYLSESASLEIYQVLMTSFTVSHRQASCIKLMRTLVLEDSSQLNCANTSKDSLLSD